MGPLDELYMERACELARRGIGNTSPNPPVGAVVVRDGHIVGEGYHHRAGEPHAEAHALREAGEQARGAALYVSLEPCNHQGRTPPCTHAIVRSGIARTFIGTRDPNPKTDGSGISYLREHGIAVEIADSKAAAAVIEAFAFAVRSPHPYLSLKMATSLDGFVASNPGRQEWLTGRQTAAFVRELRIAHDAVMVGAGTVRIDNPLLTVRPLHHRLRKYVRVVACEENAVDPSSAIFSTMPGYARTIVLAPAGAVSRFADLLRVADVIAVGERTDHRLNLELALTTLKARGISSVLCEGGPTLAGHLLSAGLVDRVYWLVAPRLLRSERSVPVLAGGTVNVGPGLRFDRVETLGTDVLISGIVERHV